jgi:poly-gamma-glutamate synthesis protein (capsule biosynthesis protein)
VGQHTNKYRNGAWKFTKVFIFTLTTVLCGGMLILLTVSLLGIRGKASAADTASESENAETAQSAESVSGLAEPITSEDRANAAASASRGNMNAAVQEDSGNYVKNPAENGQVTCVFAGDILFDSGYSVMTRISQNGGIQGVISADLLTEMQSADITMVNNEFPYTNDGTPTAGKKYTFHANPTSVSLLRDMGVDAVSVANNHSYDYGETGLLNTLTTLESVGIAHVGAGRNIDEASRIIYYHVGDMKIALIAATDIEQMDNPDTKGATETSPGVFRSVDDTLLLQRIGEARAAGAFVIVFIHWGKESVTEPTWLQLQQAPEIAAAGADLIVGDHSHCLQKFDYVNGVPVIYSLGNFLFNSKAVDTGLLKATFDTKGLKTLQFIPALQQGCTVSSAQDTEKTRILNEMASMSPNVSIDADGVVTAK